MIVDSVRLPVSLTFIEAQKATNEDFNTLYNIILECTRWLNKNGIDQWRRVYPETKFANDIQTGDVIKFILHGKIIGTATLYKDQPEYYPDGIFDRNDNAWYLCRFAVSRNKKYHGMGSLCLRAVENLAANNGVDYLRLDISQNNPFLERYYHNHYYRIISESTVFGDNTLFMEKCLF